MFKLYCCSNKTAAKNHICECDHLTIKHQTVCCQLLTVIHTALHQQLVTGQNLCQRYLVPDHAPC